MAYNINIDNEKTRDFAAGFEADWQKKQNNLYMALDNAVNLGRYGISGKRFGFAADSDKDKEKVLGLLAGWLKYRKMDNENIFAPVGGKSSLAEFQKQGSKVDNRTGAIREFFEIFTGGNNTRKVNALIDIAKSMGEYSVEMPDISKKMDDREFREYVRNSKINGFIADSLSTLFFSPEEYNRDPSEVHFNENLMNSFWRNLGVKDKENFNKAADYTRIHRDMALVADGFVEAAKNDGDSLSEKSAAAIGNYADKFGKYNTEKAKKYKTKELSAEFCDLFHIDSDKKNENYEVTFNADDNGVAAGKSSDFLKDSDILDPYLMNVGDFTFINTLAGTSHRSEDGLKKALGNINIDGESLAGKEIGEASAIIKKAFSEGKPIITTEVQTYTESNIRVFNNDPNAFTKKSSSTEKKDAKIYFNSLFGTVNYDTADLLKLLRHMEIDGQSTERSFPKGMNIVNAQKKFRELIMTDKDKEHNLTIINGGKKEKIIMQLPGSSEREFLNDMLGTDIRSSSEFENETKRIRIGGKGLEELTKNAENKIAEAEKIIRDAHKNKIPIEITPGENVKFRIKRMAYEPSENPGYIKLEEPKTVASQKQKFAAEDNIIAVSDRNSDLSQLYKQITGRDLHIRTRNSKTKQNLNEFLAEDLKSIYINGESAVGLAGDIKNINKKWRDVMACISRALQDDKNVVSYIPDECLKDPEKTPPKVIVRGALDLGFEMNAEKNAEILKNISDLTDAIKNNKLKSAETVMKEREERNKAEEAARAEERERRLRRQAEEAEAQRKEIERMEAEVAKKREEARRRYVDSLYEEIGDKNKRPNMSFGLTDGCKDGIDVLERLSGLGIDRLGDNVKINYGSYCMRAADRIFINGVPSRTYFNIGEDATEKDYADMGRKIHTMMVRTLLVGNDKNYVMFKAEDETTFHAFTHTDEQIYREPAVVKKYGPIKRRFYSDESVAQNEKEYNQYLKDMERYKLDTDNQKRWAKITELATSAASSIKYVDPTKYVKQVNLNSIAPSTDLQQTQPQSSPTVKPPENSKTK